MRTASEHQSVANKQMVVRYSNGGLNTGSDACYHGTGHLYTEPFEYPTSKSLPLE